MTTTDEAQLIEPLTPREQVVLEHLRHGLTNRQIAAKLDISADGVKFHVSSILGKLGVRSRHQAAYWPEQAPWWAGGIAPIFFWWRRTAPAIGGKISTTTAWLAGGALFATMAGLALLAFLIIQNRESTAVEILFLEPALALVQAVDETRSASSYRMTISQANGEPGGLQQILDVRFEAPDRYWALSHNYIVTSNTLCGRSSSGPITPGSSTAPFPTYTDEECVESTPEVEDLGVLEIVLANGAGYSRQCNDVGQGCQDWTTPSPAETPGPLIFGAGLEYGPHWPLLLVESLSSVTYEGVDVLNGTELHRFRGLGNAQRAALMAVAEALEGTGTPYGTICASDQECTEVGFEETLQEDEVFSQENVTNVDVWLSPSDLSVRRIVVLAAPPAPSDILISPQFPFDVPYIVIEFSDFGNVRVELPE